MVGELGNSLTKQSKGSRHMSLASGFVPREGHNVSCIVW